jgi:sugar lactone lactonase YvrE
MAYDERPGGGALYRLDRDGAVTTVLTGVTISNGLAWSPDGSRAYYNDTATHRVDVFDYEPATGLTGRRPFAEIPDGGNPDGLTVDGLGGVWVALFGRSAVWRFDPGGRRDEVIELPVSQVTACTFGGPELDRLFITTSRENLPDDVELPAGSLYVAEPGVRGLPVLEFAG